MLSSIADFDKNYRVEKKMVVGVWEMFTLQPIKD
jgi:hypothetical protein